MALDSWVKYRRLSPHCDKEQVSKHHLVCTKSTCCLGIDCYHTINHSCSAHYHAIMKQGRRVCSLTYLFLAERDHHALHRESSAALWLAISSKEDSKLSPVLREMPTRQIRRRTAWPHGWLRYGNKCRLALSTGESRANTWAKHINLLCVCNQDAGLTCWRSDIMMNPANKEAILDDLLLNKHFHHGYRQE